MSEEKTSKKKDAAERRQWESEKAALSELPHEHSLFPELEPKASEEGQK